MMGNVSLPAGWRQMMLGQVAEVQTGIAKGKVTNESAVTLPYLRVANVQDGYIDLSVVKEITLRSSKVSRYSLQKGDVLLTEGGDFDKLGRGTVWNGEIDPCVHQNHIFAVRPDPHCLLPEFLAFQTASEYGKFYFQLSSKQSTNLASINSTQLKQFPVLVPPLFEQHKIVEILKTWDRAIELTSALLEAARKRKHGLMQILLTGKRRFPEFEGEPWRQVRLGDVATVIVSNVDKKSKDKEWPVQLCNYTDVYKFDTIGPSQKFMESTATLAQIQKFKLNVNDVIITKDSETADDIAIPAYVTETVDNLVCGYHLAIIRPGQMANGQFLKFSFELSSTRHYFRTQANGAVRFGLTIDSIKSAVFSIPSIKEQKRIACILTEAEIEISTLNKLCQSLHTEKKGLMQKLLTGKRRVKIDEVMP